VTAVAPVQSEFEHEALFYEGPDGFLAGTVPFVREGLEAGEPVMVAAPADRLTALRGELGSDAGAVRFADMGVMGRNPGRIIPAWQQFVDAHDAPAMRGIGEPVWAGRSPAELAECQLHEALINLAFASARGFRLICPYDVRALDHGVVHAARCSHPVVVADGAAEVSGEYAGAAAPVAGFDAPLPPPPRLGGVLAFERGSLDEVRHLVTRFARAAGAPPIRAADLVLATDEAAANSVRHGGGHGILRLWREDDLLVCEVRDRGRVRDPLVGRRTPQQGQIGGWGVWIAHQVCDLVQLRSGPDGTVVRLFVQV
jgi:anti-sigma regulatory factor (Ser/Thr protein kinase)